MRAAMMDMPRILTDVWERCQARARRASKVERTIPLLKRRNFCVQGPPIRRNLPAAHDFSVDCAVRLKRAVDHGAMSRAGGAPRRSARDGAVEAVARVAEAGDDVAELVEVVIEGPED